MRDSNSCLTTTLGVDARDLQQSVRVSGLDPAKLVSSGMINGTCFCWLLLLAYTIISSMQLRGSNHVLHLRVLLFPLLSWELTGSCFALC